MDITVSILQVRKLRLRKASPCAPNHATKSWKRQNLNSGLSHPESEHSTCCFQAGCEADIFIWPLSGECSPRGRAGWPLVPLSTSDLESHLSLPVITWMKTVNPAASLVIL